MGDFGCFASERLAEALCGAAEVAYSVFSGSRRDLIFPSRRVIAGIVEDLRGVLFPGFFSDKSLPLGMLRFNSAVVIDETRRRLAEQIRRGFCFSCAKGEDECGGSMCEDKAMGIADEFMGALPSIQEMLIEDSTAAYKGDPAAESPEECVFSYPGVIAVTNYRIANALYRLGVPVIPRMITELAHSSTGIDIHPGASIGRKFFIDHGTGVVIGETCVIGDGCRLYQGVTLGARSFSEDENGSLVKGLPRHPILGDGVIIYAGATVLGRVRIGSGAVIGGNLWITRDVPAGETVVFRG